MWSIIQRELREQSRQAASYWLRLLGAVVLLALFWLVWRSDIARSIPNGRGYFVGLNRLLFFTIWLVGPVLTADCLSREKREGTLGLLFLTPLRAIDVVLGKSFVNALRAFSVLLATAPVLVIPVLMGGLNWPDAVRMLFLHCAALGLALASGLVASSCTSRWLRARLLSFVLAVVAGTVFLLLHTGLSSVAVWQAAPAINSPLTLPQIFGHQFETVWFRVGLTIRSPAYFWRDFSVGSGGWHSVRLAAIVLGASLVLVLGAILVATRAVKRTWQAEPLPPVWQRRLRFFTDVRVSKQWFRRRMSRRLDFNPVWWRHSSTWSARVTMWGWLGLTMILLTAAFTGLGTAGTKANWLLEQLLLVGVAFSASASFRQERDSGAMELLLVTGLEPARMLQGRLLALVAQFGPAAVLVWGLPVIQALIGWDASATEGLWGLLWMLPTAMLGITLSLSRVTFLTAFLLTAGAHYLPPVIRLVLAWLYGPALAAHPPFWSDSSGGAQFVFELLLAALVVWRSWRKAVRCLAERTFLLPTKKLQPGGPPAPAVTLPAKP